MCYLKVMTSPVFRFVILVNLILDCVINCDAPPFPKLEKLRASHTHQPHNFHFLVEWLQERFYLPMPLW